MAILAIAWDSGANRLRVQTGGYGSGLIAPQSIISSLIAPFAVGDGHLASGLNAGKITAGLLPPATISGLPYSNLALSGRLADADILSGITATKLLSGYPGERVASGYPAVGLTGLIAQARISGLLVSGLMLSGGIEPQDIRFLAGMISRPTPVGCVLDLDFNEGVGSIAYDKSGLNNDGAITGATWADGIFGKCLNFDGNDYVYCGGDISLRPDTYTVEGWVYPTAAGNEVLLSLGYSWPTFGAPWSTTTLITYLGAGYYRFFSVPNISNGWHHVAFTVENNDITTTKAYLDGVERPNAGGDTTGSAASKDRCRIGGTEGQAWNFHGSIPKVRIHNYVLSADEIRGRYIQGLAKLGKIQGSVRLFNSGWAPKIWFDPESADLRLISGALRTSGQYYAGSQQVQMTTPAGYITSAFTSGWMGYSRLHSGLISPANLLNPAMVSGLPYGNLYLTNGIVDGDILSGITAGKLIGTIPALPLSGRSLSDLGSRAHSLLQSIGADDHHIQFTSGLHSFIHPVGLIPDLDASKIATGIFAQARISGLPYANLALSGSIVSGDIRSGQIGTDHLSRSFLFRFTSGDVGPRGNIRLEGDPTPGSLEGGEFHLLPGAGESFPDAFRIDRAGDEWRFHTSGVMKWAVNVSGYLTAGTIPGERVTGTRYFGVADKTILTGYRAGENLSGGRYPVCLRGVLYSGYVRMAHYATDLERYPAIGVAEHALSGGPVNIVIGGPTDITMLAGDWPVYGETALLWNPSIGQAVRGTRDAFGSGQIIQAIGYGLGSGKIFVTADADYDIVPGHL